MIGVTTSSLHTDKPQNDGKTLKLSRLWDYWQTVRNRLLANPEFQKRAAALPLVRTVARHKARELFDLCAGFVYSQVLLACVRLKVFQELAKDPKSLAECSAFFSLPEDSLVCLFEAAVSLDLLSQRKDGRYTLGPHGAALLANPGIEKMVEHNALLYEDLRDPLAFLKNTTGDTALSRYWSYARASDPAKLTDAEIKDYSALMSGTQPLVAEEILDAYPFEAHTRLLDVGGGEGLFLCAVAQRYAHLDLTLFDLPPVVARAKDTFRALPASSKATVVGGNFFQDPLPSGYDLVTVLRILHDHPDDKVHHLLVNIHKALLPHGRLLIGEPLADTPGAEPMGAAYFGFYLKAMGSGRPRTPQELQKLLLQAGFRHVTALPTRIPLQTSLLVATP